MEEKKEKKEQWHWQEAGTAWKGIGIYHLTLTVTSRQPLLGTLVIPDNDPTQTRVERTELGNAIVEEMNGLKRYFPEIKIIQHCLMPDHLHFILYVTKPMAKSIREVARGFWQGVKKIGRAYSATQQSQSPTTLSPSIIPELNSGAMNGAATNRGSFPDPLFHEMPFIRPMSRRGQLKTMIRYVQMNPQRLATKRLHPGFFRVQQGIELAGHTFAGVGNAALLLSERFAPVHVRRTMVEAAEHGDTEPLRNYMNGCVIQARQGTVMVSPFISPKEKEIMMVLLREQKPFILLADNGFSDYYKPFDVLFDAVAKGRVLILSPWLHDDGKHHISRQECVALNHMAEDICNGI